MEKKCNTCAHEQDPNDFTMHVKCINCCGGANWVEKGTEKKCGTCFNYPNNTALKMQHCNACGVLVNGEPSQWTPQINKGEKKMELNLKAVNTVVQVQFKDKFGNLSKDYSFKTSLNLNAGDIVVVDTSTNGATVAIVSNTNITDGRSLKATRWVIEKVDMTQHQARIAKEAKLLALREKLEVRRIQLEDTTVYANLAMHDQKMANLWQEYVTLQGRF